MWCLPALYWQDRQKVTIRQSMSITICTGKYPGKTLETETIVVLLQSHPLSKPHHLEGPYEFGSHLCVAIPTAQAIPSSSGCQPLESLLEKSQ